MHASRGERHRRDYTKKRLQTDPAESRPLGESCARRKAGSVPAQMWAEEQQGQAQSRCRCGLGEAIPGADMGSCEQSLGAIVAVVSPVPVQT